MQIIAGRHRGRTLKTVRGMDTRPVLGKVREALFNVLGDISGLNVLDLFAGTGAVGIEALSRGADSLTSVEKAGAACRVIQANLDTLGETAHLFRGDALKALGRWRKTDETFDLVFADPPYDTGLSQQVILLALAGGLLSSSGLLAVTVRSSEIVPGDETWGGDPLPDGHEMVFDRRYGDTRLVIYRRYF